MKTREKYKILIIFTFSILIKNPCYSAFMETKELKKAIRKTISQLKKNDSAEEKLRRSEIIMRKIEALPEFSAAHTVLIYYSLPDEVQTEAFLERWNQKKRLVLPVVVGNDLELREYNPLMLKPGYFEIREPEGTRIVHPSEVELAVIPGVAFDAARNRLGRGKGFYDRLIPHLKCRLVGIGYQFQVVEAVPVESFDKPLDQVLTEDTTY